jgi:thioredoxin reductase (NADPH)
VAERGGSIETMRADDVYLLTGYHPDTDLMARAGITIHPETQAPEHDPKTLEADVPGLFVAGSVVSGKETNRVFIENGKFHGEIIVNTILARMNRV